MKFFTDSISLQTWFMTTTRFYRCTVSRTKFDKPFFAVSAGGLHSSQRGDFIGLLWHSTCQKITVVARLLAYSVADDSWTRSFIWRSQLYTRARYDFAMQSFLDLIMSICVHQQTQTWSTYYNDRRLVVFLVWCAQSTARSGGGDSVVRHGRNSITEKKRLLLLH